MKFVHCKHSSEVTLNTLVFVQSSGEVFRGRTVDQIDDNHFKIYLIDIGAHQTYKFSDLMVVSNSNKNKQHFRMFEHPPRVFECSLAEVQGCSRLSPESEWSIRAIKYFKAKTMDTKEILVAQIYSVVNGVASVELIKKDVSINKVLIYMDFAEFREESYMSKKDHIEREKAQLPGCPRIEASQEFHDRPEEIDIFSGVPPRRKECHVRYEFKGSPVSPLESRLVPVSRYLEKTNVIVDPGSINHVLLETEPELSISRLFIGANVFDKTVTNAKTFTVISVSVLGILRFLSFTN